SEKAPKLAPKVSEEELQKEYDSMEALLPALPMWKSNLKPENEPPADTKLEPIEDLPIDVLRDIYRTHHRVRRHLHALGDTPLRIGVQQSQAERHLGQTCTTYGVFFINKILEELNALDGMQVFPL